MSPTPAACCASLAQPDMTVEDAAVTARLFKALSDPNRVLIVNLLANAPEAVCVCDLNVQLELSQPTVSHHLKKLVEAGLLTREQRGVWAFYRPDRTALARLATVFRVDTDAERSSS
jgi:ArsR family transcriptional regulator